ncbi:hypothetical protein [Arsenophonus sp. PmNCSU2021_1]|uniref:hypothetical protein n=1 Tax=Arsenophonus sp. PmNCSU2021_1 TaxID=3118989 RepID=UPI002FF2B852
MKQEKFFRRGIYAVREYQAEADLNALNHIEEAMTKKTGYKKMEFVCKCKDKAPENHT